MAAALTSDFHITLSVWHLPSSKTAGRFTQQRILNDGPLYCKKHAINQNQHWIETYLDEKIRTFSFLISIFSQNLANMKVILHYSTSFALFIALLLFEGTACTSKTSHAGAPWHDSAQAIPGRLECEKYDQGGEGIAYHDVDSINNGSGKLNPDDGSFLHTYRMKEGVDISFTKPGGIDNNPFNRIMPDTGRLYVGWTEPGEWINYTVDIKKEGDYSGKIRYTSRYGGSVSIDLDGKPWLKAVSLDSTFHAGDTVAWRQWHHWNDQVLFTRLHMPSGRHLLTLRTVEKGNMNYDYIEFDALP